jgi:hypothetical protein
MKTVIFECEKCKEEIEMFRFGSERLEKWLKGEKIDKEIECKCGCKKVKYIPIPKGSGQFQKFPVFGP